MRMEEIAICFCLPNSLFLPALFSTFYFMTTTRAKRAQSCAVGSTSDLFSMNGNGCIRVLMYVHKYIVLQ